MFILLHKIQISSPVCSLSINTDYRWDRDPDLSYLRLTEVITALAMILTYCMHTHTHSLLPLLCVYEESGGIRGEGCHCTVLLMGRSWYENPLWALFP